MGKRCTIMRGLPGSGKSHWVKNNVVDGTCICSADDFFMTKGQCVFVKEKIAEAHNACLLLFLGLVHNHNPNIVVDNTNVRLFEIAPYYRIAEACGYDVEIVWMQCNPDVCKERNVHGVPPEVINMMAKSFEPIPSFWNMRVVSN